jgi:serine/threonine protein phosphatase 1
LIKIYKEIGLIVSHSSAAEYMLHNQDEKFEVDVIWERNSFPKKIPDLFNVFGHTPQEQPLIKDHFACIDTGCFATWDRRRYARLTALQYPQMNIYQQYNVEGEIHNET